MMTRLRAMLIIYIFVIDEHTDGGVSAILDTIICYMQLMTICDDVQLRDTRSKESIIKSKYTIMQTMWIIKASSEECNTVTEAVTG